MYRENELGPYHERTLEQIAALDRLLGIREEEPVELLGGAAQSKGESDSER